ncbi:MAG: ComF family protein [Wenzhouxiangella sp.]
MKAIRALVSGLGRRLVNREDGFRVDHWLYPPTCLLCGLEAGYHSDCCDHCRRDLPLIEAACQRCGLEVAHSVDECGRCQQQPPAFDATWSAFAYRGAIEGLVQRFKFQRDLAAGRVLAEQMARRLSELPIPMPDCLVPVPLHIRRRLWRGFNQAELLCRDLTRCLGGPVWRPLLRRRQATRAQSGLAAEQRRGNVQGAFGVRRVPPGIRHVALVDDVMTTGATLDECARVLKAAGIERVDVWVAARA